MKNSIIIPFHSNDNLLDRCLESISSTKNYDDEIIVVANNADDKKLNFNFSKYPCEVIYIYDNLMYPKAINIGAEKATGDNLIFCDADISVTNGWLDNLIYKLYDKNVGYVSAKLLDIHTKKIWEFGTACSVYNFPHPYKNRPIDFYLCKSDHIVWGACAACSAIKRNTFLNMNGFDERLVCSYSDLDLTIRLKSEYNLDTVCVANSLVYHQGNSTQNSGMSTNLKEDTKGIFTAKHTKIDCNIDKYIKRASQYFLRLYSPCNEYFCVNISTIANPELYIECLSECLNISIIDQYKKPYPIRDANYIDLINHIHHSIRTYKIPILYFVDSFIALTGNALWKECRNNYSDIVMDRHANIEMLSQIVG